MYNLSDEQLIELFDREPIDIWINSFGGCRSNYIRDSLKNKYRTYNKAYEYKACHYIKPLNVSVGSGIFCYVDDVSIALTSQLNRNMKHNYQKLMEGVEPITYSIGNWLLGINKQIDNWVNNSYFPTIIINTDKINNYKDKFEEVFGVELLPYKRRKTKKIHHSLIGYEKDIENINDKLSKLDDFKLLNYG